MTSFAEPPGGRPGDQRRNVDINVDADVSGYTQAMGQAQRQTDALNSSVNSLTQKLDGLSKSAGKKLVHFSAADFAGLAGATADAAALEHQLGTLRATSAVTGTSMKGLKRDVDAVFDRFPVHRSQVVQLTEAIANMGVTSPKSIGSLSTTFTKLGAATGQSPTALAGGGIQLSRMMGTLDPERVDKYANALLTVSKNEGVAATGVLSFSQNIAAAARQAGIGEDAVLGISAAFQKAGADGYRAATAFNRVVSEITQLNKTGSPQLAKYSTFVGKTLGQFRQMSPTQQFQSVFQGLSQGGPRSMEFLSQLGLGYRAQESIRAVVQSGSLPQAIAQAQQAGTNTRNLDEGSKAAFSGLTNELSRVRNQFVRLGDEIGGPLLKPLGALASGLASMLHGVNAIVKAMGPVAPAAGMVIGAGALAGGLALGHAGLVATAALGRQAFTRTGVGRAFREGRQTSQLVSGGMTEEEAASRTRSGMLIAGGRMPAPARAAYSFGRRLGAPGTSTLGGVFRTGLRAGRAGVALTANAALAGSTWMVNQQSRGLADSRRPDFQRSAYRDQQRVTRRLSRARVAEAASLRTTTKEMGSFSKATVRLASETTKAAVSMASASARIAASGTVGAIGASGGAIRRGAARGVLGAGRLAGGLMRGVGALGRFAFNPYVMMGTLIGAPLVSGLVHHFQSQAQKPYEVDSSLNPLAKYDQLLDKSSSNLADFNTNVNAASKSLAKFATQTPGQVARVTAADRSAAYAGNYKMGNEAISAVAKGSPHNAAAGIAYIQSLAAQNGGVLSGDTLTAIKRDFLHAYGPGGEQVVDKILKGYAKSVPQGGAPQGINYGALGSIANGLGGDQFKQLSGAAISGIQSQSQIGGGKQAQLAKLAAVIQFGTSALTGNFSNSHEKTFSADLAKLFGGNASDYELIHENSPKLMYIEGQHAQKRFQTTAGARRAIASQLLNAPSMASTLQSLGINPKSPNAVNLLLNAINQSNGFPGKSAAEAFPVLQKQGALGRQIAGMQSFQSALGSQSGNPRASMQAMQEVTSRAKSSTGSLSAANSALLKLSDTLGGTSSAAGNLLYQASQWARTLQSYKLPTMSRQQQLGVAIQNVQGSYAAATGPNATAESVKQYKSDVDAYEQQKEAYRQYMISVQRTTNQFYTQMSRERRNHNRQVFVTERNFHVQMEQSNQDHLTQVARAQRDFNRQQSRQQVDYNIQVARAEKNYDIQARRQAVDHHTQLARGAQDFRLQQARSDQDYYIRRARMQADYLRQTRRTQQDHQIQVQRQTEDFHRQLTRQAEDAAKSIYDPFSRIQAKYTIDAGTLVQNLEDQNRRITQQLSELKKLRDMGVSQQAIDTLQLVKPENSQQLTELVGSIANNPQLVQRINELVSVRVQSTTSLVQSQYSDTFRRTVEDFQRGMERTSDDFKRAQQRARDDENRTLSQMAQDYSRTQQRAADDYSRTVKRMSQDYAKSRQRAAQDLSRSLSNMEKDMAKARSRASKDFETTMSDMEKDYNKMRTRASKNLSRTLSDMSYSYRTAISDAATDLQQSLREIYGSFASVFGNTLDAVNQKLAVWAPEAAGKIERQLDKLQQKYPMLFSDWMGGYYGYGGGGYVGGMTGVTTNSSGKPMYYAEGGISLTAQLAHVSEQNRPEMHLPLDLRGENFMASIIAKSLAKGITMAAGAASSSTTMSDDHSISFAGADITVQAQDPNEMARKLADEARLHQLVSPTAH